MSLRAKLVMTAVNIVCLIFTLFQPNPATPIALLPIIATACVWLFASSDRDSRNRRRKSYYILLSAALLLAIASCIFAFFAVPTSYQDCLSGEIILFKPDVFLLSNRYFDYLFFAAAALIVVLTLYMGELMQSLHCEPPIHMPQPFNDTVREMIEKG